MTRDHGTDLRLTIVVGRDTWHHKPLFFEIVRRARRAGLAGASVFRGQEGFGVSSPVPATRRWSLSKDLSFTIVIVDEAERIWAFLPQLDELVDNALVTVEEVTVVCDTGGRR